MWNGAHQVDTWVGLVVFLWIKKDSTKEAVEELFHWWWIFKPQPNLVIY